MNEYFETDILDFITSRSLSPDRPLIRPIRNITELRKVYQLTHDCYVSSGYRGPHPTGLVVHYPEYDYIPETTILVAVRNGEIVGSISYTLDGPAGFPLEKEFKSECDAIRRDQVAAATVWRLVVQKSEQNNRTVVISLINEVFSQLLRKEVTTVLFSVNPKHENVYKRLLNMQVMARKEATEGLANAPAVLLRGDRDTIRQDPTAPPVEKLYNPIFTLLANSPY